MLGFPYPCLEFPPLSVIEDMLLMMSMLVPREVPMLVITNEVLSSAMKSLHWKMLPLRPQDVDVNSCWIVHTYRSIKVLHSLSYGISHEKSSMMVPSRLVISS